ncbi:MAG: hypothetical protein V1781_06895, partial [Bacteroidota bacterium]
NRANKKQNCTKPIRFGWLCTVFKIKTLYINELGASVKTDTTTIKLTDIETTGRNIINQATVCRHDRPTLLYFLFFPTAHFLKTIFRLTHIAHICKPHKPTHNQSLQKSAISHRTISIVVPIKTLNLRLS